MHSSNLPPKMEPNGSNFLYRADLEGITEVEFSLPGVFSFILPFSRSLPYRPSVIPPGILVGIQAEIPEFKHGCQVFIDLEFIRK